MIPMKLKPIYDKTIWANNVLTKIRKDDVEGAGTSWEVSAHPYCSNVILNGEYKGKTLQEAIDDDEKGMLGTLSQDKLLRCAFLDAKGDLSIQVHPYESYAKEHDNDHGKTESWYVLKADKGSKLVAGTNTTDSEKVKKAIADENLEKCLTYHDIVEGDFIHINAGELHALGGGILAIEVGTNSNTTYRFYDYGRKDANGNGRELHLEKSFDVVDLSLKSKVVHNPLDNRTNTIKTLVDCEQYQVEMIDVIDEMELETNNKFNTLVFVLNGAKIECNDEVIDVNYCDSLFVPAKCNKYKIIGNCRIIRGIAK